MVNQLSRLKLNTDNQNKSFDYLRDVYEDCLKQYLERPQYIGTVLDSINNGRKILQHDSEVSTYIAFYGAQHYYKLIETFESLNISQFSDHNIEIISYGCGAATDICSLISYCRSKQINLPFAKLTLIEPSYNSLTKGFDYIKQALSPREFAQKSIKQIYKKINDLEINDIFSNSKNIKLHIFSNILDLEAIDLVRLASLIKNSQTGTNYFICVSPQRYGGEARIDAFYQSMLSQARVNHICRKNQPIINKLWSMKKNSYINNYYIDRYHRIFSAAF